MNGAHARRTVANCSGVITINGDRYVGRLPYGMFKFTIPLMYGKTLTATDDSDNGFVLYRE